MAECPLTARQIEVARLVVIGMTYKAIGARLGLATSTISSHMAAVYARLGEHRGRGAALSRILDEGWVADPRSRYTIFSQRGRRGWLPSAAEMLYIEAFESAIDDDRDVELYRAVLYDRAGVEHEDRCDGMAAMFRKLGAVICTPEQRALLQLVDFHTRV